ncbi:hypothetical protein FQR65_LT11576 [Abscondita terminalis]|nr:hypothetical protein FQR65_LT11576 [Abscondita terminalis]
MISLIVFFAAIVAVISEGQEVAVSQDTLGNYRLKYAIPGISRVEHGDAHGNVNGGFSYIDPHGIVRKTEFTSGVHGYNAIGTDIPLPVQDTPEVAHEKAKHLAALHAAYLVPRIPEFQGPDFFAPFVHPFVPLGHFAQGPIAHFQHFAPPPLAPFHFGHFASAPAHFVGPNFPQLFASETPQNLILPAGHSFKSFSH